MKLRQWFPLLVAVFLIASSAGPAGAALVTDLVDHEGTLTLQANNGLQVTDQTDQEFYAQPFVDDNSIAADGYYVHSNGTASATVVRADGTWTNLTQLDVDQSYVRINGTGTEHFAVAGGTQNISVRGIDYSKSSNGKADIRYAGASGKTTITLYNQSADFGYKIVDLQTGNVVASGFPDAQGRITFTVSNSEHTLDLRQGSSKPYVRAASPIANAYDTDRSVTLNATVVDPEGSDIEVEFFVKRATESSYTKIATTTVASNTSATASYTASPEVTNWKVRLTTVDDSDQANSTVFRFRTPGVASVFNASTTVPTANLQRLKKQVQLTIQSTDSNFQRRQTVSDSTFDLKGVPDERLRLTFQRDGFANRTLVIENPARNRTTHMVPHPDSNLPARNRTFVQRYELNDKTGSFPADETRLVVQDYFNGTWRTVSIRAFTGENLAPPVVQAGEVYRLRVVNDGTVRDLGTTAADPQYADNILRLTVEGVNPDYGNVTRLGYDWQAGYENPDDADAFISFGYLTANDTVAREFQLTVYEQGNASNVLFSNTYGLVNELEGTLALTDQQAEKNWVVSWSATVDSERVSGKQVVGPSRAEVTVELDPFWKQTFSLGMILIVAGFFGGIRAQLGAIVVPAVAGVFWYLGWLPGWLGGGAIVLGLAIGIMFRARSSAGGIPS